MVDPKFLAAVMKTFREEMAANAERRLRAAEQLARDSDEMWKRIHGMR